MSAVVVMPHDPRYLLYRGPGIPPMACCTCHYGLEVRIARPIAKGGRS